MKVYDGSFFLCTPGRNRHSVDCAGISQFWEFLPGTQRGPSGLGVFRHSQTVLLFALKRAVKQQTTPSPYIQKLPSLWSLMKTLKILIRFAKVNDDHGLITWNGVDNCFRKPKLISSLHLALCWKGNTWKCRNQKNQDTRSGGLFGEKTISSFTSTSGLFLTILGA